MAKQRFPIWLRQTKISPDTQCENILQRPALIEKLNLYQNKVVTLLEAPAGFGKSTILTLWKCSLDSRAVNACWVSLDQGDNDENCLLNYIAFSLIEGGALFANAEMEDRFFRESSPLNQISVITNIVNTCENDFVLILDDFENLKLPVIESVIQPLIDYCPPNLHIVISTRNAENLKLANLEMSNDLTLISSSDLKFSTAQIGELVDNRLSNAAIQQLEDITQGWPALVQLINRKLLPSKDSVQFESAIRSSTKSLLNYLSEQILEGVEAEIMQFLMEVSLFEVMDPNLCDHVRDANDSLKWLSKSEILTNILSPSEASFNSYRFHPLIRDLLYQQLERSDPQLFQKLHSRAARWFLQKDDLIVAINHCVIANNTDLSIKLFEEVGPVELWIKEGFKRIKLIIDLIGEKELAQSPRASLVLCVLDIMNGNPHYARDRYLALYKFHESAKHSREQHEVEKFLAEAKMIDSFICCFEGELDSSKILRLLEKSAQKTANKEHAILGFDFIMLSFAYSTCGLFDKALTFSTKAKFHFEKCNARYGKVHACYHIACNYYALGDYDRAKIFFAKSSKLARQYFADDKSLKLILTIFVSEVQYENNQLEEISRSFMKMSSQLESRQAWADLYASGYTTSYYLEYHHFGYSAASNVLKRGMARAKSENLVALSTLLLFQQCLLMLRAGKTARARELVDQSGFKLRYFTSRDVKKYSYKVRDSAIFAFVRLNIAEQNCSQAIADLEPLRETFSHIRSTIYCRVLLALSYYGEGDKLTAMSHLDRALKLSQNHRITRLFLDELKSLAPVLKDYIAGENPSISNRSIHQAKGILKLKLQNRNKIGSDSILSNRELEVLKLLSVDYSNKLIARELEISDNTVRFHLKNIFSKLHVNSRKKAVEIALDRKLLKENNTN